MLPATPPTRAPRSIHSARPNQLGASDYRPARRLAPDGDDAADKGHGLLPGRRPPGARKGCPGPGPQAGRIQQKRWTAAGTAGLARGMGIGSPTRFKRWSPLPCPLSPAPGRLRGCKWSRRRGRERIAHGSGARDRRSPTGPTRSIGAQSRRKRSKRMPACSPSSTPSCGGACSWRRMPGFTNFKACASRQTVASFPSCSARICWTPSPRGGRAIQGGIVVSRLFRPGNRGRPALGEPGLQP
ncbi:hypothetical protein DFJ74DRAFT_654570 [Hyaloraphidium curvatum]|nr:hypothetical protein DFJ74DRAFT_654570 [Hyaloraphidium curvatum]